MLTGTLTLTLQTEDDILLAAEIIRQRRLDEKHKSKEFATPIALENKVKIKDAHLIDELRNAFKDRAFRRAEADVLANSASNCGRVLREAIENGQLQRIKAGWYRFKSIEQQKEPASTDNKKKRHVSKKRLSMLKTLENEMLYLNFKSKLEKLNPDKDIEQLIDRTLEPEEALNDIKKKHPDIQIYEYKEQSFEDQFKEYLESIGITDPANQQLAITRMQIDPLSEEELKAFALTLQSALQEPPSRGVGK